MSRGLTLIAEQIYANFSTSPALAFRFVSIQFSAKTSAVRTRLPRPGRPWSDYADSIDIWAVLSYIGMRQLTPTRLLAFAVTVFLLSAQEGLTSRILGIDNDRTYHSGWLTPSIHIAETPIPATTGFPK